VVEKRATTGTYTFSLSLPSPPIHSTKPRSRISKQPTVVNEGNHKEFSWPKKNNLGIAAEQNFVVTVDVTVVKENINYIIVLCQVYSLSEERETTQRN
jgi:hypothetical protein